MHLTKCNGINLNKRDNQTLHFVKCNVINFRNIMSDIIMTENQYNIFSLNFADEFKIIKDIVFFKNTILLSIMKKAGLYKIKYFPKKYFKYHYYKGTKLIFVSNVLKSC